MFNYVKNRFNGTRSLFPTGHEGSLFHFRVVRAAERVRTCRNCVRSISKARLGWALVGSMSWRGQVDPPPFRAGYLAGPNQPLCIQPVGDMGQVRHTAVSPVFIADG